MPGSRFCVSAGPEGTVGISDFGIAVMEADLASEFEDRQSLVGVQSPSGGFHKRHLVSHVPSPRLPLKGSHLRVSNSSTCSSARRSSAEQSHWEERVMW